MKKDSGLVIKAAYLHEPIVWPGITGSEKTLIPSKVPGIIMSLLPQGLLISAKGKKGEHKNALIPYANVANFVLEDGDLTDK